MDSLINTHGVRLDSEPGRSNSVVLPRELTPLVAEGAVMEILAVHEDWLNRKLHGSCSGIQLPTKEEARASLWMEQNIMDGVRDYISYECHDLRVVKVDSQGALQVLICKRVEPTPDPSGIETAPINGFWWSIGGRREIAKPNSPLDGKFNFIDSVLYKAKREGGVNPADVVAIYDLGIGRTEFPASMRYISKGETEDGTVSEKTKEVHLARPQRTINRNIIILIESTSLVSDQTVERLSFMTEAQYADPRVRAQFCDYEQKFLDAMFDGWRESKIKDRKLTDN